MSEFEVIKEGLRQFAINYQSAIDDDDYERANKYLTNAALVHFEAYRRANSGLLERKHRENDLPISATKNQINKRRAES